MSDLKTNIETASKAGGPAVNVKVSISVSGNISLTGVTKAIRRVVPLNDSMAVRDLNLLTDVSVYVGNKRLIGGLNALGAGTGPLIDASLARFNNGRGVRIGTSVTDVLLVGTADGVMRAFDPVGSPAAEVYPTVVSATVGNCVQTTG